MKSTVDTSQRIFDNFCRGQERFFVLLVAPARVGISAFDEPVDHEMEVIFCHGIEDLFIPPLPGKRLLSRHEISFRNVFPDFFWVIKFFALFTGMVTKVEWIDYFLYLQPHLIIGGRQCKGF